MTVLHTDTYVLITWSGPKRQGRATIHASVPLASFGGPLPASHTLCDVPLETIATFDAYLIPHWALKAPGWCEACRSAALARMAADPR